MTDIFQKMWLRAHTYIDNLSPGQNRQVRALCERFFEKGRKYERDRIMCYHPALIDRAQEKSDAAGCKD